jgi:hypothetical protein
MRKILAAAAAVALFLSAPPDTFAKTPATSKASTGTIVIVFKDGHRQSFNLAEIARVEFPGASETTSASVNPAWPARGRYVGKWAVGDGNGSTFMITLEESGEAYRSIGDVHGKWAYVDGEARVTWDDGAQDAIRKAGSGFEKYAYKAGKSFTDSPDNVTSAHNTTPKPI